jgi:FixJ family two-component response regulator
VSGSASAVEASKAGAMGFLAKPYMAETVVQVVADTIKRHSAHPAPQHAFL